MRTLVREVEGQRVAGSPGDLEQDGVYEAMDSGHGDLVVYARYPVIAEGNTSHL